jgi:D-alanyl-D-alanine carboxypeptidase
MVASDAADARGHLHLTKKAAAVHRAEAAYSPPSASIIVDGNTGEVLHAFNADGLSHPASLTKIITLYLLFERLESGAIKLDTPLMLSAHAAAQAPSKLGIKAGQAMPVDQAIKAVVTKSANDIAVAIAENLAGDEKEFAKLMTLKARALGMSRTTYVNASGLPDDDQITTAHDQALLGRAIEDRFPRYYPYFATREFVYRGVAMRNHNHLLGSVEGVDGIKTGYTQESGFNLSGRYKDLCGLRCGSPAGAECQRSDTAGPGENHPFWYRIGAGPITCAKARESAGHSPFTFTYRRPG